MTCGGEAAGAPALLGREFAPFPDLFMRALDFCGAPCRRPRKVARTGFRMGGADVGKFMP